MNFRRLSIEELEHLQKEFTLFLSAQGIDFLLWESLKKEDQPRVDSLLESFSDYIWTQIFATKKYMVFYSQNEKYLLDFGSTDVQILQINYVDNNIGLKKVPFTLSREEDMYQWHQQGGDFCDGIAYKEALMLWAQNQNVIL